MVLIVCAGHLGAEAPSGVGSKPIEKPLPRVLLIGDSISIGYTADVQKLLQHVAQVTHAPGNNGHSGNGLRNAAAWVGKGAWDVIHFNHGIWDVHLLDGDTIAWPSEEDDFSKLTRRHTQEEYLANLEGMLRILRPAARTVIFATTTPWTTYGEETSRRIAENNQAACSLMRRERVLIDDLHAVAATNLAAWHARDGVHFNATGYRQLATAVARSIAAALGVTLDEAAIGPVAAGMPSPVPAAPGPVASGTAAAAGSADVESYFERGGTR